jgi:hypothetical protein
MYVDKVSHTTSAYVTKYADMICESVFICALNWSKLARVNFLQNGLKLYRLKVVLYMKVMRSKLQVCKTYGTKIAI